MAIENTTPFSKALFWLLLSLLAIFPISSTIALRNLMLLLLSATFLVLLGFRHGRFAYPLRQSLKTLPFPILFWVGFLFLFPLWARQSATAWRSLGMEWIEALLAGFVGFAAFHWLGRRGPGLLALGFASAVPLILHLLLCIAALLGLLSNAFYADPTISTLWDSLVHPMAYQANPHWTLQQLMHGFRGIEPMHGNLGYPACQAIALFGAHLVHAIRGRNSSGQLLSIGGIALCFLSILIAQSRGAILYAFLIMALCFALAKSGLGTVAASSKGDDKSHGSWRGMVLGLVTVGLLLSVTYQYVKRDPRWFNMADSVQAAFAIQDPTKVICEGLDSTTQDAIRLHLQGRDPVYVQAVIEGLKSDGGRVLLLRVGWQLVRENPLGLDGSRHSYQKLIAEKCGHTPMMQFAHSHNSWLDLALALGWMGAFAFASMMVYFLYSGLSGMRSNPDSPWAMALVLISSFWILRGFADSVYREHYMQMQLLLLMYLFGRRKFVLGHAQTASAAANEAG